MVGVARRAWATNPHAVETVRAFHRSHGATDRITLPYPAVHDAVSALIEDEDYERPG